MKPVAIAISAFRSDEAVIQLLERIHADPHPDVAKIIIVDSMGAGRMQGLIAARNWQVDYLDSTENIGSAGNLGKRLELAASHNVSWCLCLNHDADWSSSRLSRMLTAASVDDLTGAIYPILDHHPRKPRWNIGRTRFIPSSGMSMCVLPEGNEPIRVRWSSSNGALYSTAPFRKGTRVMHELWMGYEDLALGIDLEKNGWAQYACPSAVLPHSVEYLEVKIFNRTFYIPDKPVWYSYYNIRNLILIQQKYRPSDLSAFQIMKKLLQSGLRIVLLENNKSKRLSLLLAGTFAGLRSEIGKGRVP